MHLYIWNRVGSQKFIQTIRPAIIENMLNNLHLSRLVHEQAKIYQERPALSYRDYDRDCWISVTWRKFAAMVSSVSHSLVELGVAECENIAVFSQNKPECLYVDFGAYGARVVTVPFYATSSGAQVSYMVNDASVRVLFVGEQLQYDTAFSVISVCPTLEKIVIFDKAVKKHPNDHLSIYFDEFVALGEGKGHEAECENRVSRSQFSDMANILYTSGTTGNSKGVMLTFGMYHEALRVNDMALSLSEDDVALNFLPFTHVFERAWSCWCLARGVRLAINLRPLDVQKSLQEVHPTCMCSVPRFWEKVYQAVLEKMESGSFVQRTLIKDALEVGGRIWEEYTSKGLKAPMGLSLKYKFYDNTIIKVLRKTLGLERGNFFPVAGAAIPREVERFVHAAGINIVAGYGLTESTATVCCDLPEKTVTLGSVGRVVKDLEIKFGENNEILLRGKTITPGYYKKEAETRAVIDEDGWFHTGDAGYMKDGEVFLTERIKDLFKTSNGKYIAPQAIESKLVIDKYIEQAVIVADQHKFVSALIVPAFGAIEKYFAEQGVTFANKTELCRSEKVQKLVAERIDTLQQDLANYEKVKRFSLLETPFTIEGGELTNTLKVKRRVVYEKYAHFIDEMYKESE